MKKVENCLSMTVLLFLACLALCSARKFDVQQTEMTTSWKKTATRASGLVEFRVNFAHRNRDRIEQLHAEITNPKSPRYGQYLTSRELNAILNPLMVEKKPVFDWLVAHHCMFTDFGQHARVKCDASNVERMLQTRLHVGVNKVNKRVSVKAFEGFHVPDRLLSVLSTVRPIGGALTVLEPPRKLGFVIDQSAANVAVVPQSLENMYSINNLAVSTPYNVITQAVAEFGNDNAYLPSDLAAFSAGMLVNIEGTVVHHGPFNPSPPDAESTLDIQYIAATGRNATSSFWVVAGWLHEWLGDLQASQSPPEVSSISWGADERQEGSSYNTEVDAQFQALNLLGCTFLAASGDTGAAGAACRSSRYDFNPGYPATSPYVLSVGATQISGSYTPGNFNTPFCSQSSVPCVGTGVEEPANVPAYQFSSGGGFSTYAKQPAWQAQAVQKYLSARGVKLPPSKDFTKTNRGFPDVAAAGWQIVIQLGGSWQGIGGTSASSPIFAGMISLMNDARRKAGKPKLGFVNPVIYSMANTTGIFTRIGSTKDNNSNGCKYGYEASGSLAPWDPYIGLGTINLAAALQWMKVNL